MHEVICESPLIFEYYMKMLSPVSNGLKLKKNKITLSKPKKCNFITVALSKKFPNLPLFALLAVTSDSLVFVIIATVATCVLVFLPIDSFVCDFTFFLSLTFHFIFCLFPFYLTLKIYFCSKIVKLRYFLCICLGNFIK